MIEPKSIFKTYPKKYNFKRKVVHNFPFYLFIKLTYLYLSCIKLVPVHDLANYETLPVPETDGWLFSCEHTDRGCKSHWTAKWKKESSINCGVNIYWAHNSWETLLWHRSSLRMRHYATLLFKGPDEGGGLSTLWPSRRYMRAVNIFVNISDPFLLAKCDVCASTWY